MNKKSRMVFFSVIIVIIVGIITMFSLAYRKEKKNELQAAQNQKVTENSGSKGDSQKKQQEKKKKKTKNYTEEEIAEMTKKALKSEVHINAEFPQLPERFEKVTYQYREDLHGSKMKEKLELYLQDNPEGMFFKLERTYFTILDDRFTEPTRENPYVFCYGDDLRNPGFRLSLWKNSKIKKKWEKLSKEDVIQRVKVFLDNLGITYADSDTWEIKKQNKVLGYNYTPIKDKNFYVTVKQDYEGIPLNTVSIRDGLWMPVLNFCYGEKGWLEIDIGAVLEMQGTGEYITEYKDTDEIISDLETMLKADIVNGKQRLNVEEINYCYLQVDETNLRPVWKLRTYYTANGSMMGIERILYIDVETGELFE